MKALYILFIGLLANRPLLLMGQTETAQASNIVRRVHTDYDEEIMYFGKHNKYFTVRTLLKNGTLFRLDSYQILPQTLPNGYRLDSTSRISRYGPTKIMYFSGQPYITCEYRDDALNGPFMVFYEDGSIKRKEYYRSGRLTESRCYTPDGTKQTCMPFYQAAKFTGKPDELSAYLKQKLGPLIDGDRIRRITATLAINEIGQVTKVGVVVNANASDNVQMPEAVTYVQQVIRNMSEWTPEKVSWQPALNDGRAITSTCILSVYRTYGTLQYNMFYRL